MTIQVDVKMPDECDFVGRITYKHEDGAETSYDLSAGESGSYGCYDGCDVHVTEVRDLEESIEPEADAVAEAMNAEDC